MIEIRIGQVLLGAFFAIAGLEHFKDLRGVAAPLVARGLPAPVAITVFGSVVQIAAGVALAFHWWPRLAAYTLIAFTVCASLLFLNFWDKQGPERLGMTRGFTANIAIIGGLLIASAV